MLCPGTWSPCRPQDWDSPPCTLAIWALGRGTRAGPAWGLWGGTPSSRPAVLASPPPPSRKMATNFLVHEKIWFDKFKYDDAERKFYEQMNGPVAGSSRQVGPTLGDGEWLCQL